MEISHITVFLQFYKFQFMSFRFLFFCLFFNTLYPQSNFLSVDLKTVDSEKTLKEVKLIKDQRNGDYYTVLEEEKTTYAFKYNKNKALLGQITSEGLKRKYKEIIGHIIKGNQLILIQKNNKGNKFAYIKYDFANQTTIEEEYEIEDRSDRFVESYITPDYLIMFTINFNDNTFKKWRFFIDGNYKVEKVPFTSILKASDSDLKLTRDYLGEAQGLSTVVQMSKVNNKIPNNLEITTELNKMYEYEDSFYWTIDHEKEFTILINFKSPDFYPEVNLIPKPAREKTNCISNSFVFENKIAQVASNNKEMVVEIKSLEKPYQVIKKLQVNKDEDIPFRNSPILQEGSAYSFGATRKMEKTSKLLRKMTSDKNGISILKINNKYHATIGGTRPQNTGGGMMMPGFGAMPVTQFGAVTMSYNPTFYAYGTYASTGSTRIECLFDTNFNHVPGDIPQNVFDKIDDFKEILDGYKTESVNFIDDNVIFGYWEPKAQMYFFKVFE